jgi:alkanesulfonate monooxygenase SsuD/methylene tetrahydromethanopterin reductase-like flavin-dependent oxidoreductase (luciferase family)
VRGPVALAKALAALDLLSDGRLIAGLGPGSSQGDYDAVGVPFEDRWKRFDQALADVRAVLDELAPQVPVWVASWGSPAGLARVARTGDGWLASAYNTTPERFAAARAQLGLPSALATMWTWVTDERAAADRMLTDVLAPFLNRDPGALRAQVCVGPAEHCAELLSRYAAAGCGRAYLWPLDDEPRQLERIAGEVEPLLSTYSRSALPTAPCNALRAASKP